MSSTQNMLVFSQTFCMHTCTNIVYVYIYPENTIVLCILFDIYYTSQRSPVVVISSVPKPRELPGCALPTQTAAFYAQWKAQEHRF